MKRSEMFIPTDITLSQRREYDLLTESQKAIYDVAIDAGADHEDALDAVECHRSRAQS